MPRTVDRLVAKPSPFSLAFGVKNDAQHQLNHFLRFDEWRVVLDGHFGFGFAELMRKRLALGLPLVVIATLLGWWLWRAKRVAVPPVINEPSDAEVISGNARDAAGASNSAPTNVYAHNLMLRKGSTGFRVYVRWLAGRWPEPPARLTLHSTTPIRFSST